VNDDIETIRRGLQDIPQRGPYEAALGRLEAHLNAARAEAKGANMVLDAKEAENVRLRAALKEIADKGKYGCCRPTMYPDAPVCSHDIARNALVEEEA